MGKAERRKVLYDRHIKKQTLEQQISGKLIEENHNGRDYSPEYTTKAVSWYFYEIWMKTVKYLEKPAEFSRFFSRLREKLQTLLLHWPDSKERGWEFWFIYDLLGLYREGRGLELLDVAKKNFKEHAVSV